MFFKLVHQSMRNASCNLRQSMMCEKFKNQPDFFELDQSVGLSCNNPFTVLANWKLKSESGCCEAS